MATRKKKREAKASKRAAKRAAAARAKAQKTQRAGSGYEYKPPKRKPVVSQAEMDRRISRTRTLAEPRSKWLRSSRMAKPGPTPTFDLFRDPVGVSRRLGDRGMPMVGWPEGRNIPDEGVSGAREAGTRAKVEARQKAARENAKRSTELRRRMNKSAAKQTGKGKAPDSYTTYKGDKVIARGGSKGTQKTPASGSMRRETPIEKARRAAQQEANRRGRPPHMKNKQKQRVFGPDHGPREKIKRPKVSGGTKPTGSTKVDRVKAPPRMVNQPTTYDRGWLGPMDDTKYKSGRKFPKGIEKKMPKVGGAVGRAVTTVLPYIVYKSLEHRNKMKSARDRRKAQEERLEVKPTKFKKARIVPTPKAKPRKKKRRSTEPASWNYEAGVSDDL